MWGDRKDREERRDKKNKQEEPRRTKVGSIAALQWLACQKVDPEGLLLERKHQKEAPKKHGGRSHGSYPPSTEDRSDWSASYDSVPTRSASSTPHKSAREAGKNSEDDYGPPPSYASRKQERIMDWAAGVSPGTSVASSRTSRSSRSHTSTHRDRESSVFPSDSVSRRGGSVAPPQTPIPRSGGREPAFPPPRSYPGPSVASPNTEASRSSRASQRSGSSQTTGSLDFTSSGGRTPADRESRRFGR